PKPTMPTFRIPDVTPLNEPPAIGSRPARALRYVREVAQEDAVVGIGIVAWLVVYLLAVLAFFWWTTIRTGQWLTGIPGTLFMAMIILGVMAPALAFFYTRLFIPLRVFTDSGRIDSYTHPKWKRLLGHAYVWKINGVYGIAMNDDMTPFEGRKRRPIVSDAATFNDLNKEDVRNDAYSSGLSWEKVDPLLWIGALGMSFFMMLVLWS